jgi:hypothetical protein
MGQCRCYFVATDEKSRRVSLVSSMALLYRLPPSMRHPAPYGFVGLSDRTGLPAPKGLLMESAKKGLP